MHQEIKKRTLLSLKQYSVMTVYIVFHFFFRNKCFWVFLVLSVVFLVTEENYAIAPEHSQFYIDVYYSIFSLLSWVSLLPTDFSYSSFSSLSWVFIVLILHEC